MAADAQKQQFFQFRRFGEDPADDVRKVALGLAGVAGLVALIFFVFRKLGGWEEYGRPAMSWSLIFAASAGVTWLFQRNFKNFGVEVITELRRVTWPTWVEVKRNTMLVLGVMFLFSITVLIYDQIFGVLFTKVINLYPLS